MGYVDFSNAHIECIDRVALRKTSLGINNIVGGTAFGVTQLRNSSAQVISSNHSSYTTNITNNSYSIVVDGTFNQSGNCFYIPTKDCAPPPDAPSSTIGVGYIVTNIEFESGDHYSFQINISFNYS